MSLIIFSFDITIQINNWDNHITNYLFNMINKIEALKGII